MKAVFKEPIGPDADFYEQFQYGKNPPSIIVTLVGSREFCEKNYKQIIHAIGVLKPTVIQDVQEESLHLV